jgi:hypothetical protein
MILTVAIVIFGFQPGWITRWSEPTILATLHQPVAIVNTVSGQVQVPEDVGLHSLTQPTTLPTLSSQLPTPNS